MDHLRKIIFSRKTTCKMADPVLYCYLVKKIKYRLSRVVEGPAL